jgi:DNA-binding response OmpR family regulator
VSKTIRPIAIFNASDDTVEMLKEMLSFRGFLGVHGRVDDIKSGEFDFVAFMEAHNPIGVIWDIAPPYDRNWTFFKLLRTTTPLADCPVVLTTTHKKHLDDLVGTDTGAIEVVGKPYDLGLIVDAIEGALERTSRARLRLLGGEPVKDPA